jgi:hypothetical protein
MPSAETFLRNKIETASGIDAYPMAAPSAAVPPFVVFSRVGTTRERTLGGTTDTAIGMFSVEIFSDGYADGKDLADLCRASIHSFSGTVDGLVVMDASIEDESDSEPTYFDGREVPTYQISQSYKIFWEE